jgi:hypothetical protein
VSDAPQKHSHPGHQVRHRKTVALLLVLACLVTPLAIGSYWLRNEVLNTHQYVETVTPLSSNKAIDAAVAGEITTELFKHVNVAAEAQQVLPEKAQFLSLPLTTALRQYTQDGVERFLQTSEFRRLWQFANTQAHQTLVDALEGKPSPLLSADGSVNINLANAVAAARQALAVAGLHIFDKVKPSLLQRQFVIAKPRSLAQIRRGVNVLRALAIALPLLSVGLVALALALSRERKRTLFWAGAALTAAGALGFAAIVVLRTYYLDKVVGPSVPHDAAAAFYDTLLSRLRLDLKIACYVGLAGAGAAVLAGPSPAATRIRRGALRMAGMLADEAVGESVTAKWVAANRPILRTAIVILGLLVLLTAANPNVRLLVKLAIGVLVALGVIEVLARPAAPKHRRAS